MFSRFPSLCKGLVLCAAALLTASSAQAQTSPSGHVSARTTYPPRRTAPPPFSIMPGDHMFQATMKIAHSYQAAERVAPLVRYRPPARQPSVQEEPAGVEVAVTEPEESMEKIAIRGPNGEVRYFPIVGGRKAIKARTIIVRPGQTIHLVVQGGHVTVSRK